MWEIRKNLYLIQPHHTVTKYLVNIFNHDIIALKCCYSIKVSHYVKRKVYTLCQVKSLMNVIFMNSCAYLCEILKKQTIMTSATEYIEAIIMKALPFFF